MNRSCSRVTVLRGAPSALYLRAPHTVSVRLRRSAVASLLGPTFLRVQVRTQFAQIPGKRDQEAFLAQFNPLDVLGLNESCTVDDIDEAFKRMSAKYGPNGPTPNAQMVDRVFRAHEVLKDPASPYYLRAHSSDSDRQRLQFQLLPKRQRRLIKGQAGMLVLFLAGIAMLVISMTFRPVKRMLRAATR
ncbi:DnaJ domain containing protein [Trypanosoma brucei equiperdum]|uniref:DnaJ domain containing protein n=1 Tax=Trypanosoma brucei equiperdum TaxID=630700 RepID=A0A3L6KV97_9TRYP|nr:DnaJ domain containing protein [Trypanosoma brucei equiperdum]